MPRGRVGAAWRARSGIVRTSVVSDILPTGMLRLTILVLLFVPGCSPTGSCFRQGGPLCTANTTEANCGKGGTFVAEDVSAEALTKVARDAAGDILQQVIVFDVYRGEGVDSRRKSIGLGLILQDASRTLTDEDADKTMRSVMLRLEHEFGAALRT